MTGQEFRQLLIDKWGQAYDVQLRRTQGKIFLQILWKYFGQASFPLTEAEYQTHLDDVINYLHALGAIEQVQKFIIDTKERPRIGKAVSIPLSLANLGDRASEWMM